MYVICATLLMKNVLLLFLSLSTTLVHSKIETQDFERLDVEKVMSDIDTIKQEIDSTFYYINATGFPGPEKVEIFGCKKTIQMNSGIFLPMVIFVGLYFLWLRGRRISK